MDQTAYSTRKSSTSHDTPVTVSVTGTLGNYHIFESDDSEGSLRDRHDAAGAWFVGPKAENARHFRRFIETILGDLFEYRRNYAPEDPVRSHLPFNSAF